MIRWNNIGKIVIKNFQYLARFRHDRTIFNKSYVTLFICAKITECWLVEEGSRYFFLILLLKKAKLLAPDWTNARNTRSWLAVGTAFTFL